MMNAKHDEMRRDAIADIIETLKKTGEKKVQVAFDFGSVAYVRVNLYEEKTFEECLKMRSEAIDGYIEDGKYIKIK